MVKTSTSTWLLSPTEHELAEKLKDKAVTSPIPETKGADILIYTQKGLVGVQRKKCPDDFILSFTDGRLAKGTSLLVTQCKFPVFIRECPFKYFPNLHVAVIRKGSGKPEESWFTKAHVFTTLFDLFYIKNVVVIDTKDIDETIYCLEGLEHFMNTSKHLSLFTRPHATGAWYVPSTQDLDLWLLQSFPSVGPVVADNIIKHFGGRAPLAWTCTLDELKKVPGMTVKKAEEIYSSIASLRSSNKVDELKARLSVMRSQTNG